MLGIYLREVQHHKVDSHVAGFGRASDLTFSQRGNRSQRASQPHVHKESCRVGARQTVNAWKNYTGYTALQVLRLTRPQSSRSDDTPIPHMPSNSKVASKCLGRHVHARSAIATRHGRWSAGVSSADSKDVRYLLAVPKTTPRDRGSRWSTSAREIKVFTSSL